MTDASAQPRGTRGVLPPNLQPRGLSRVEAAAYVGVSATLFDQLIAERTMPHPKRIHRRRIWDRLQLDAAFAAIPSEGGDAVEDTWADYDNDVWSKVAV